MQRCYSQSRGNANDIVDLISVRAHLDSNCQLDGDAFDEFVRTGRVPVGT
jgi:hypothetical protein